MAHPSFRATSISELIAFARTQEHFDVGTPLEATVRYGLLAPIGTPRPIIDRINSELRANVSAGNARSRIAAQGGEPLFSTPEEYAADIDREQTKWGLLIKKLGLRVD